MKTAILAAFLLLAGCDKDVGLIDPADNPEYVKEVTDPPPGWYIQYNKISKEYRWCDTDDYCTPWGEPSRMDAVRSAWSQVKFRRSQSEDNWHRVK